MNPAFFELHKDLPREGPGDLESLDWALSQVNLAQDAAILDAGCGPGADIAGLLAHVPDGRVTAIELHTPFVEAAANAFAGEPRVTVMEGDMATPPGGPYDLIWCAGALYFLGVADGLTAWKRVLKPGGFVAFSEPLYFVETPSDEARAFWDGHPVGHRADVLADIAAAGFTLKADRKLPDAAWEAYYQPLEARIARLRDGADEALTAVLDEGDAEASGWRAHKEATGYGQFVVSL